MMRRFLRVRHVQARARSAGLEAFLAAAMLALTIGPAYGQGLTSGVPTCRHIVLLLMDVTGSFSKWLPSAVDAGKGALASLRPGDCAVVRPIGVRSFNDVEFPPLRLPVSSRPIDPALQRRVAQLKRQFAGRLEAFKSMPPAGHTDLWGALHAAGQILGASGGAERFLLIYSDLKDTQGLKPNGLDLRLDGVKVGVYFLPRDGDPGAFARRIAFWRKVLERAGAATVAFFDTSLMPVGGQQ